MTRAWVEQVTGGTVTAWDPVGEGASRAAFAVDVATPEGSRRLLLRHEGGTGPTAGTELTLAREAVVYRALAETGVRIPAFVALSDDGQDLLMERAEGSADFRAVDAVEGPALIGTYVDELARLHRLDADRLALPGFERPVAPPDAARNEVALWRRILDGRVGEAALARHGLDWLDGHAPTVVERVVLCHGDVGPGNFLFEAGRITAMIDWEFAHLGDPMDDLAWLAFRGHHMTGNCGDLRANLARWSAATGLAVDPGRVAWYRALVIARWLISCLSALAHDPDGADHVVHRMLVPLTSHQLCVALDAMAGPDERRLLAPFAEEARAAVEANPMLVAMAAKPFEEIPAP